MFIGDLCTDTPGVAVPGLDDRVRDHKYADDVAALAESPEELRTTLRRVLRWAQREDMELAAAKCGVMCVGGDRQELDAHKEWWAAGGVTIPVVSTYKYLGVQFTDDADLEEAARHRQATVQRAFAAMRPHLADTRIPRELRRQALVTYVLPHATYAGELLGMNTTHSRGTERVLEDALRCVYSLPKSTASAVLWAEARLQPLHVRWAAARARAMQK